MTFKRSKVAYYLLFVVFLFSCKNEKTHPRTSSTSTSLESLLSCPNSKLEKTHLVHMQGRFTTKAQTIVPVGEKPFPIVLNKPDLEKLNLGSKNILCRVLERHGIGAGKDLEPALSPLPKITIEFGPGLKLKNEKMEFHIPPAEKSPELLSNFEHSLDRLLGPTP